MKRCSICKIDKPLSEFFKDRRKRYGVKCCCKQCHEARYAKDRETAKKTPEARAKKRAWNRGRERSEAAKERERKHAIKSRELYPEKEAARQAVVHALRKGLLIRPDQCERCGIVPPKGKNGRSMIQSHHPDYSKMLDIEWLCVDCHSAEHNRALAPETAAPQEHDWPHEAIFQHTCMYCKVQYLGAQESYICYKCELEARAANKIAEAAAAPGTAIETPRTDAMEHDGLRTLALQEANGESSRSSCSVAPITDAHLRHLAVQQIVDLERDLTRVRTACLALADEMERTGREGDAKRLREITK